MSLLAIVAAAVLGQPVVESLLRRDAAEAVLPTVAPLTSDPESSAAPTTQPWRLFENARFDATWLLQNGSDGLGINDLEVSATLNIPLGRDVAPLRITPYAAARSWAAPTQPGFPDLPSSLYDFSAELAWRSRLAEWLFVDLALTPGFYSDLKAVDGDGLQLRGRALAIVALSEQFQFVGGAMYVNRNETKVLPAGGVIWNPNEDTRCFLVFPQPKVSMRFATVGVTQLWHYVAGEFGGGRWAVERAAGGSDSLDYTDFRIMAGVEAVRAQWLCAHFDFGYVFARRLNYASAAADYHPANTWMLRAGVRF